MGFGLGQIAQSFNNSISAYSSVFTSFGNPSGGIRTHSYVHTEGVTNKIKPANWKLNLPYSFRVEGVSAPSLGMKSPISGLVNLLGPASGGGLFDEFTLPINPRTLNQDENFTANITPTQRGIVVEHNGVVVKDLVIEGTTGMRPDNYKTGYEWFQELRNYFRAYAELKKDPNQKNAQMYFINRKDNEWLAIEGLKFSTSRSANGAYLYDYKITAKVIGQRGPIVSRGIIGDFISQIDNVIETANDYILGGRRIFENTIDTLTSIERDFTNTILQPIESLGIAFKTFQAVPVTFADIPRNFTDALSTRTKIAILDDAFEKQQNGDLKFLDIDFPVNNKTEVEANGTNSLSIIPYEAREEMESTFLTTKEQEELQSIIPSVIDIPRKFYSDLKSELTRIRDNASEKFGIDMGLYNTLNGRTNVFNVDSDREPTDEELDILEGFRKIELGLNIILSSDVLFKDTFESDVEDIIANFDERLVISTPYSAKEIILPVDATLEDLASEFLGDPSRWIEIALVNNLVFPYIDENSTVATIKKPGDRILIPLTTPADPSNIPQTKRYPFTENITETERNLGVDLKLDKNFDLILNNANDYALVSGPENAAQAVILALSIEKGDNKYHPEKGVGLSIGEKIRNGEDVRDDIVLSVLSDLRFTNLTDLTFLQRSTATYVSFNLAIKRLNQAVPVTVPV